MTTIFELRGTDEQIDVLRGRLLATRWPSYDSRDDWSLGTSSDDAKRLAQYWATQFDFDSLQQRLAALPHECVIIDDVTVHLVHVRSPHPQAVPVIITHGWPSSFLEIVPLIERMTQPEGLVGVPKIPAIWLSPRCQDSDFHLQHEPSKDIPALLSPTCGRAR